MTVADIKEYIDEIEKHFVENSKYPFLTNDNLKILLNNIKSMLDELEPPIEIDTKKYFETMDKIISEEIKRSKS